MNEWEMDDGGSKQGENWKRSCLFISFISHNDNDTDTGRLFPHSSSQVYLHTKPLFLSLSFTWLYRIQAFILLKMEYCLNKETLNSKNVKRVEGRKGFHNFSNEYLLYTFFTLMKVVCTLHTIFVRKSVNRIASSFLSFI